jgi:hypothetical protein
MALANFLTYVKNSQLKVEIRFELIISGNHSQSVSYTFIKMSSVAETSVNLSQLRRLELNIFYIY